MKHWKSKRNYEAPERFSSTLTERLIMCGQGIQRKRWIEQLGLGNGEVMELKFIQNDEALKYFAEQLK